MSAFDPAECPECGALVIYATTTAGTKVAANARPTSHGLLAVHRGQDGLLGYWVKGDARAAEAEAGRLHEPHLHGGESGGMVSLDPAIEAVEDTLHGLVQEHEVERILRLAASTPDGRKALIGLVEDCGGAA